MSNRSTFFVIYVKNYIDQDLPGIYINEQTCQIQNLQLEELEE